MSAADGRSRGGGCWRAALTVWLMLACLAVVCEGAKDMMRKSIVFDKNTPDVFYCPIHKPTGFDKLIVKARPLKKLCEFEGERLPEDYKSDCYQDVDESDYACKEKYRIMMRMHPPGGEDEWSEGQRMARFLNVDRQFYVAKMGSHVADTDTTDPKDKKKQHGRQPARPQRLTQSRGKVRYRLPAHLQQELTPGQSHLRDRLRYY